MVVLYCTRHPIGYDFVVLALGFLMLTAILCNLVIHESEDTVLVFNIICTYTKCFENHVVCIQLCESPIYTVSFNRRMYVFECLTER